VSRFPSAVTWRELEASCGGSVVAVLGLGTGIVRGRARAALSTSLSLRGVGGTCCEIAEGAHSTSERTIVRVAIHAGTVFEQEGSEVPDMGRTSGIVQGILFTDRAL
jgi:hypothetical protein